MIGRSRFVVGEPVSVSRRGSGSSLARHRSASLRVRAAEEKPDPSFGLDELDPVRLGRKSRQAFDDLWSQFATLASPTKSFSESGLYRESIFDVDPDAPKTKVLIIGATGKTGRIVLRKLLLRGYQVRVLVRNEKALEEMIPTRVEVVIGDVTDPYSCQKAVDGVDKIVFAASSRVAHPEAYANVFDLGLRNMLHAFMDHKWVSNNDVSGGPKKALAKFRKPEVFDAWNAQVLGRVRRFEDEVDEVVPETCLMQDGAVKHWTRGSNSFIIKTTTKGNLKFRGGINAISAAAEIGAPVQPEQISDSEGIILRLRGDGNVYSAVCTMDDGRKFAAQFMTKWGYSTVRIPYTLFRPDTGGGDTLEGSRIVNIGIRYENRGKPVIFNDGTIGQPAGRFNLELDWIKTLPASNTTEFVLVSCAGVPRDELDVDTLKQILYVQRRGEAMLRNSGVTYTIVRPTTLLDEPGGLKALVFDQGDRLSESISAVDAADVTVRSLPQPLASNKTFEVAHESTSPDGDNEAYELVAHVPDKSTNYLGAALANLQKNT